MELHNLKNAPGARKQRKRVGRGPSSGHGKTAGRGHNGQKSRSGYSRNFGFEGGQMPLHRRLPKRGFHHDKRWPVAVINLDVLSDAFDDGAEVTTAVLVEKGLVDETTGGVKVLGRGDLAKKLTVKVQAISASAQAKIEAAGGSVDIISIAGVQAAAAEETA